MAGRTDGNDVPYHVGRKCKLGGGQSKVKEIRAMHKLRGGQRSL
jgi:hypothetical protein